MNIHKLLKEDKKALENTRMLTIILYFSFVLLSSGQTFSDEQFFVVDIEETAVEQIICSLTNVKPYYDCTEKWTLYLYDVEFPKVCNENVSFGTASKACTKYTTFRDDVVSANIHLGNDHGTQTIFPYPDGS